MDVIYSIGARFGGAGIGSVAYNATKEIQEKGYLKKVICWSDESKRIGRGKVSAVLPFGSLLSRVHIPYLIDNLYDALASLQIDDCDIFHGWNHFSLLSMRKARKLGAKTFIERASSHILKYERLMEEEYNRFGISGKPVNWRVVKKCLDEYRECDYVLVPSEFAYNSFLEQGFDEERLVKIPFGVDTRKFKPGVKKDETFRVLFVGQVILRKGLQYLLKAFSELKLENAELLVKGKVQWEMKGIVEQYNRMRNLRFINWVDNLNELYSSASVFVLPSIEEGSALVTYEAMACGLPVITTPNSGSVVRDGKDGFIIPIRDVKSLKEKILYFYENEDEIKRMGRNARNQVSRYSWEEYGRKLCRVYEMALE